MRPKLLKSFLFVLSFWFIVTTLWWTFANPDVNLATARRLASLLPFLPVSLPERATVLDALTLQAMVFTYWTAPVLGMTLLSVALGIAFTWIRARREARDRDDRERGKGQFRGVTTTLGDFYEPNELPREEISLEGAADDIKRLTAAELKLLEEILGTILASRSEFSGFGVADSLPDHTLALVQRALAHRRLPGLSSLVAAGHELGKITAYQRSPGGQWVGVKDHDKEAARILAMLPAWWAMPHHERLAVMLAVKYKSAPWGMPTEIEGDLGVARTAKDLLNIASSIQEEVVQQEQKKTLEKAPLSDLVFNAFLQQLPSLAFQSRGLPKGVRAVAWKTGNRVYMIEIALREAVTPHLPADVAGALQGTGRDRDRLPAFTVELLKALHERGWLVATIGKASLPPAEAVWTINSGKLSFKGVIVVDVPEQYLSQLPSKDSMYEVTVVGPMFAVPGQETVSREDLADFMNPAQPKAPGATAPAQSPPAQGPKAS